MNPIRIASLTVLAAALAACNSVPVNNTMLDQARSDYREAQANSQTQTLAATELKQAGDALASAETAFAKGDETARVNHLAYLARQRTVLAQETASRKGAEAAITAAGTERDQLRLAARTREADLATRNAALASQDAANSQRQSDAAQRQAAASQQQAALAQQQAATSQIQAGDAERRSQALEEQLRELNAKKTERGMVITIGDVLFDSGRAELKSGGLRNIERLGGFLKQYPQRKALIEGYTDSVGSDSFNQALSERRANAVRAALLDQGVAREQLDARGYGETHPVAGNDDNGGRQMNRRVEVVLSDENGVVSAR